MKNKTRRKALPEMWMRVPSDEGTAYWVDVVHGLVKSDYVKITVNGKRFPVKKTLHGSKTRSGYMQVKIGCKFRYIHDLICQAVYKMPSEQIWHAKHCRRMQVNHKNEDKLDNDFRNLEWVTQKANIRLSWGYEVEKLKMEYTEEFKALLQKLGLEEQELA